MQHDDALLVHCHTATKASHAYILEIFRSSRSQKGLTFTVARWLGYVREFMVKVRAFVTVLVNVFQLTAVHVLINIDESPVVLSFHQLELLSATHYKVL